MPGAGVGTRVAELRKLRGLNQLQLARAANISYSLLTKIEAGHAPATPAVIGALARALRADIPRLTGQPYEAASATSEQIYQPVQALRRLLLAHDIAVPPQAPPRPLEQIATDVRTSSSLRRAANFKRLAPTLPPLVEELQYLALTIEGTERERARRLLTEAYYAVECLGSGVGYQDLHLLAVERISRVADQVGDPLLIAAAKWGRSLSLMREGAYDAGLRLMADTRDTLDESSDAALAMTGSLHLREALLAARAERAEQAWAHIDEALALAHRTGETDVHDLAFGPSNAVMCAVSVGADLGDGARAVEIATGRREPLTLTPELLGCHHIDLARAYLLVGDRMRALDQLRQARRASPQQTRHHPQSREIVLAIASSGRGSEELTTFSNWLGIS
jgi:transcriptional regulator with XRE-family HTH domain